MSDETKKEAKETDAIKPLELDRFNSEDHGDHWHLFCQICGEGWVINKPLTPEALLPLMNHAASHKN